MNARSRCVVLDTHIFLGGISGFVDPQADTETDHPFSMVCGHVKRICYRIAINGNIVDEYVLIAPRHRLSPLLLRDIIERLKRIGKTQWTAKRAGRRAITVGSAQDRMFIEAAIGSRAKYVVTRDPRSSAFEDLARKHGFKIVGPDAYLDADHNS